MNNKLYSMSKSTMGLIISLLLIFSFQTMAFGSEAEDNKKIADECQRKAMEKSVGDGQTKSFCQQAIYFECLAENFQASYPEQSKKLESNKDKVCEILKSMDAQCEACD